MSEKIDVQQAIEKAIRTEKEAMDFYKYGAQKMADNKARAVFELLAREERQHARSFFDIYQGQAIPDFEAFIESAPDTESGWFQALNQAMLTGFDERKALELALEKEDELAAQLRKTAAEIDDPKVKDVYLANANSTSHHSTLIDEEYHAMMGASR